MSSGNWEYTCQGSYSKLDDQLPPLESQYHVLSNPLPLEMWIGAIIDQPQNPQILNTRHETPQFEPARIREATKRNEFFTLRCARGKEGGPVTCSMQMLAPTMRTVELASPTAKDYTRTRVSSAAVQDWLARHKHKKPLYMVTGIKTVTDARFVHRYSRAVKKWYTWQGLRERRLRPQQPPELVATTMTGEHPFSVRITKMEYKKTGKDRWADYEWVYEPFTEGALAH
ncbi:hypothetical protein ARSEF1564_008133 [Beauveria bassiana]